MYRSEGENVIATLFEEGLRLGASQPWRTLSRHMPSSSIASANKEVKSVRDAPNSVGRGKHSVYTERR